MLRDAIYHVHDGPGQVAGHRIEYIRGAPVVHFCILLDAGDEHWYPLKFLKAGSW